MTRLLESSNVSARTWIKRSRPYRDFDNPPRALGDAITEFGLANARLGYERDAYFFRVFEQEAVKAALPNAQFINCTGIVEELRVVKSDAEVALMDRGRIVEEGTHESLAASPIQPDFVCAGIHDVPQLRPTAAAAQPGPPHRYTESASFP